MANKYVAFADREIGFFERGEQIILKIDTSACAAKLDIHGYGSSSK